MTAFRIALVFGVVVTLGLTAAGLYPVALVVAAALMPLVTLLYFVDVDIYEDEPLLVLALTLAWGLIAGVVIGLFARSVSVSGSSIVGTSAGSRLLVEGLLIPVVSVALALVGPLVLLPYRRFNDVLDGTTFGAASAVALTSTRIVVVASPLIGAGLRPVGRISPWVAEILLLGVAVPTVAAASIGALTGALWLRYRAPVTDREALGVLGHPVVALLAATMLVVSAGAARVLLGPWPTLLIVSLVALVALVWLRSVIHLGLLQEVLEREVGPEITCPNCLQPTPSHTFCISCGVALGALPKGRRGVEAEVAHPELQA